MGVIDKFGSPKPVSWLLNWSRKYSLWMFNFGLACCAIEIKEYKSLCGIPIAFD